MKIIIFNRNDYAFDFIQISTSKDFNQTASGMRSNL